MSNIKTALIYGSDTGITELVVTLITKELDVELDIIEVFTIKPEDFDRYKSYMKGFLTAYNIFTENTFSITGVMKEKDVVEWLNDYCKENPMSSVENALTSFALDHHDGRMKTSARRGGR